MMEILRMKLVELAKEIIRVKRREELSKYAKKQEGERVGSKVIDNLNHCNREKLEDIMERVSEEIQLHTVGIKGGQKL